jgi:hypothetical protein
MFKKKEGLQNINFEITQTIPEFCLLVFPTSTRA